MPPISSDPMTQIYLAADARRLPPQRGFGTGALGGAQNGGGGLFHGGIGTTTFEIRWLANYQASAR
jgi:hypothetical protein